MVQLIVLIIGLLTQGSVNAKPLPLDYGAKDFDLYYDALEPWFAKNSVTGQISWADQNYLDNYFFFHSDLELHALNQFLQGEFYLSAACSKEELDQNYSYLRYAHRLVILSYLLEVNEMFNHRAKKMLFGNICQIDWTKLVEKCQPKSEYMTYFLKNSKYITSQIKPLRVSAEDSGKRFQESWMTGLRQSPDTDPTAAGVLGYCKTHKCPRLSEGTPLETTFKNLCRYNEELFLNVCSEKDELHALSYIPEMYELIGRSNILNLLDSSLNSQGCLRIFSLYSAQVEKKNDYLSSIVPALFAQLESEDGYIQGRLFPAGALMEFNIKGLAQVFEEVKKIESPEPVPKAEEIKKVEDVTVVVAKPKPEVKKAEPPKVLAKKEKPKTIPKSAFLVAVEFRNKYDLERVKVDMFKFKYDYVFTLERTKKLDQSLQPFLQRAAIEEMKRLDGLGEKKAPVPLIFLKFMIDKGKHQGLFNLTNIIGSEFYVINTIDNNIKEVDFVQLQNDETTNHKWQLVILKK